MGGVAAARRGPGEVEGSYFGRVMPLASPAGGRAGAGLELCLVAMEMSPTRGPRPKLPALPSLISPDVAARSESAVERLHRPTVRFPSCASQSPESQGVSPAEPQGGHSGKEGLREALGGLGPPC